MVYRKYALSLLLFISTISRCLLPLSSSCKPDPLSQTREGLRILWSRIQFTGLFPFSRKWIWLARLLSILRPSVVFHFAFCDSTYLWILTLNKQTRTVVKRQQTDQQTRCVHTCEGSPNTSKGVRILLKNLDRVSDYYGCPNTTSHQSWPYTDPNETG